MKAATKLFAAASGAGINLGLPLLSSRMGDALFFPITDGWYASVLICTPYATLIETERFGSVMPLGIIGDVSTYISYMGERGLRGLTDEEKNELMEGEPDE